MNNYLVDQNILMHEKYFCEIIKKNVQNFSINEIFIPTFLPEFLDISTF